MEILGTEIVVAVVVAAAEVAAIVEACEVPIGASGHLAPVVFVILGTQDLTQNCHKDSAFAADLVNSFHDHVAVEAPLVVGACRLGTQMKSLGMMLQVAEFGKREQIHCPQMVQYRID